MLSSRYAGITRAIEQLDLSDEDRQKVAQRLEEWFNNAFLL